MFQMLISHLHRYLCEALCLTMKLVNQVKGNRFTNFCLGNGKSNIVTKLNHNLTCALSYSPSIYVQILSYGTEQGGLKTLLGLFIFHSFSNSANSHITPILNILNHKIQSVK